MPLALTEIERKLLDGAEGEFRATALDMLIQFGEVFDAARLTPISYAHYPAEMAIYPGQVEQVVEWAAAGAQVPITTTTTTLACDRDQWQELGCPADLAHQQCTAVDAHRQMGLIPTYTCSPYHLGYRPARGQPIVSTESSAVVYFNSVLGARANRGGSMTRLAALLGCTPEIGYLLSENRQGTHHIHVDADTALTDPVDWSVLGYVVGQIVGDQVPVLTGLPTSLCGDDSLVALGASLATSGSVTLFHIPGVTPEANSLEQAFAGATPPQAMDVDSVMLENARQELSSTTADDIDFVVLGCPHYSPAQIEQVARLLEGKRIADHVCLWVCTARQSRDHAAAQSWVATIENAGGNVVSDTCPVEAHFRQSTCHDYGIPVPSITRLLTNSTKMARYTRSLVGCESLLADLKGCIDGALSGRWRSGR